MPEDWISECARNASRWSPIVGRDGSIVGEAPPSRAELEERLAESLESLIGRVLYAMPLDADGRPCRMGSRMVVCNGGSAEDGREFEVAGYYENGEHVYLIGAALDDYVRSDFCRRYG